MEIIDKLENETNPSLILLRKHDAIVSSIEENILPNFDIPKLYNSLDYDKLSKWKSILFRYSNPFQIIQIQNLDSGTKSFALIKGIIFQLFWLIFFSELMDFLEKYSTKYSNNTHIVIDFSIIILGLILFILTAPVYFHIYFYLKYNKGIDRYFIIFAIFIPIGILFIVFTKEAKIISIVEIFRNINNIIIDVYYLFLVLLPFMLLVTILTLFCGKLLLSIFTKLMNVFFFLTRTSTSKYIRQLINLDIIQDGRKWRITELSVNELKSIKELAKQNLTFTEMKSTPFLWILAFIGIFTTSNLFSDFVNNILKKIIYIFDKAPITSINEYFNKVILGTVFTIIVAIFLYSRIEPVNNIYTKSIMSDTCTIVLYSKENSNNLDDETNFRKEKSCFIKALFRK